MSRLASQAVGGYYPTPPHLIASIVSRLQVPAKYREWGDRGRTGGHYVFVDPCAGDGEALNQVQRAVCDYSYDTSRVYGCELEATRAVALRERVYEGLQGDAFHVDFSPGFASALYLNPPYDLDPKHKRLEHRFLLRFTETLATEGVLVFVVPAHALSASATYLATHYNHVTCARFPDEDFDVFKQVVLYAAKGGERPYPDPVIEAQVRQWAEEPFSIPVLSAAPEKVYMLPQGCNHVTWEMRHFDVKELLPRFKPFQQQARGTLIPSGIAPPRTRDLGFRTFPSALPPKPAHLAAGIASGVFDGVQLRPDNPKSGLPEILVKGVFDREYVPLEEKVNKDGDVTGIVEVQQPKLTVTALDLTTLTYHQVRSEAKPSGTTSVATATTLDLLHWYSKDMLRSLLDHCPVIHDPNNTAHEIPLAPIARPLYPAQAHATMAAIKLLGGVEATPRKRQGRAAIILGEIGSGKTGCSLTVAATIKAKKTLVMCPPHLLDSWKEQILFVVPDSDVRVLATVADVDAFAELTPKVRAFGILSREAAKLSHSMGPVEALSTRIRAHCPKCGAPIPKGDLAKSRVHCAAKQHVPRTKYHRQFLKFFWHALPAVAATLNPENASALIAPQQRRFAALYKARGPEAALAAAERLRRDPRLKAYAWFLADYVTGGWEDKATSGLSAVFALMDDPAFALEYFKRAASRAEATDAYEAKGRASHAAKIAWPYARTLPEAKDVLREAWKSIGMDSYGGIETYLGQAANLDSADASHYGVFKTAGALQGQSPVTMFARAIVDLYDPEGYTELSPCGEILYQSVPAPRRVALATYISRRYPKLADLLILDEIQDLNTDGSAQERAGHRLTSLGWPSLLLTGSIMNGYAESLFSNFWAISPEFRAEFSRSERKAFVDQYGYKKRLVQEKKDGTVITYGSQSDRVERSTRDCGQAPGVLPIFVLRHLLRYAVTLHKADLRLNLPSLTESAVPVAPTSALAGAHEALKSRLFAQVKMDAFSERSGKLWGQVAELPGHLDRASADTGNSDGGVYEVRYPEPEPTLVVSAPPVVSADEVLPKEQWALDRIKTELAEGRNVLVLSYHSNVMPRIARLIEKHTGTKVVTLVADKVPTAKRQAWIDREVVSKGRRVLVANPTTIQTGLNNLVHFATQIWLQNPACNPLVYRQAVGRIDRIGQTKETRVFFPYYEGTSQAALHKLLTQKVLVSMSTDGIDPESSMAAAGMSPDLTIAALSVGRQLYEMLGGQ